MARSPFSPHRDGTVGVRLPAGLRSVLLVELRELDALMTTTADQGPADPLAELTGMTSTDERATPQDPALHRLRPDAYGPEIDDGRAAAEYRRLAGGELEALQRGRVATVLDSLTRGDRFDLTADEAQAWVGALNDLRLVLGSRLGIVADDYSDLPSTPALQLFGLLGSLLYRLLVALGAPEDPVR